jgi:hypothetical protein
VYQHECRPQLNLLFFALCAMIPVMQKRSSIEARHLAAMIVEETAGIELRGKNPAAVALGRRGGLKGGKARAEKLTPEQRSHIAQKAARARWDGERG